MHAQTDNRSDWAKARGIYAELLAYLRHPHWMESQTPWNGMVWRQLFWLFVLDVVLVIAAALVVTGYEYALDWLGITPPMTGLDEAGNPLPLLVTACIIAPLYEEVVYRSWLKGTPRYLMVLGLAVLLFWLINVFLPFRDNQMIVTVTWGLPGLLAIGTVVGRASLWRGGRQPVPFFRRHFVWFFWASCFAFALGHVGNYDSFSLLLIPLVLPQLVAGINWAFARMRFGLPASILLHAAANSILVIPLLLLT